MDEFYDVTLTGRTAVGPVRRGAIGLGEACFAVDATVVDGGVNGAGWLTRFTAAVSVWWDTWIVDGLCVNGLAFVTRALSYPARMLQWGLVQWYALVMIFGVAGLFCYYVLR